MNNARKMSWLTALTMTLALAGAAGGAWASQEHAHGHGSMDHAAMKTSSDMADGEVRKIDMAQGKVTLRHGPIKSLDMPGMTMVFTVSDKAMLESVKPGDKVRFKATNENGRMMVTEMTPAQ